MSIPLMVVIILDLRSHPFGRKTKMHELNSINAETTIPVPKKQFQHTIQVDHETLSRLKDASDIMGECPTYTEVLDTILSHYLKCNNVERTYHYTPATYTSLP